MSTGPVIHSPLTKVTDHWITHQWTACGEMEMDYYRCASRVGAARAVVDCKLEKEDYKECVTKKKQIQRYVLLQAERRKQKKPFLEPPIRDSYGRK
ncbi:NADH dehydrogenase [ubiquinone] iron-sulfur protein 5-like [Liolophura sinensis]|uniref:NADH dehydrogenase [ubiquinone] iron-sulfur protein 5-like n=1 Tax=Liolophura sinensis TaxID=3198878 RepID=UPI003158304A